MKIKYQVSLSGPRYAVSPGDVQDVADDEAARLIEAGFAKATNEEVTVVVPPEEAPAEVAEPAPAEAPAAEPAPAPVEPAPAPAPVEPAPAPAPEAPAEAVAPSSRKKA